jgi:hypothetical protein
MQKPSDNASPMGAAIEFAQNETNNPNMAQVGDEIIFSASDKADKNGCPDYERFKDVEKYVRDGASMADTKSYACPVFGDYSATTFRQALLQRDIDTMRQYLPDELVKAGMTSDVLEILNLEAEEAPLYEVIFRLVEELLDEQHEQLASESITEKPEIELSEEEELEEISLGGGGHSGGKSNIEGAPRKNKREEHIVNEVMNYLLKATRAGI